MPSLHAAYPVLLMLFFWSSAGKWRWLLPLYPLLMAFSLVYTGEHYVFDILLGWVYAIDDLLRRDLGDERLVPAAGRVEAGAAGTGARSPRRSPAPRSAVLVEPHPGIHERPAQVRLPELGVAHPDRAGEGRPGEPRSAELGAA